MGRGWVQLLAEWNVIINRSLKWCLCGVVQIWSELFCLVFKLVGLKAALMCQCSSLNTPSRYALKKWMQVWAVYIIKVFAGIFKWIHILFFSKWFRKKQKDNLIFQIYVQLSRSFWFSLFISVVHLASVPLPPFPCYPLSTLIFVLFSPYFFLLFFLSP